MPKQSTTSDKQITLLTFETKIELKTGIIKSCRLQTSLENDADSILSLKATVYN